MFKKILIIIFLLTPTILNASEASFSVIPNKNIGVYDALIYLDTNSKEVNAVEGEIFFSKNIFVEKINYADSVVAVWLSEPKVSSGKISFSGIIPNGFLGVEGILFSLKLVALSDGNAEISFSGKSYINDGLGSEEEIKKQNIKFDVVKGSVGFDNEDDFDTNIDTNPPILRQYSISQNSEIYDGKPFLIFHAKDAESSLVSYELALSDVDIKESDTDILKDLSWKKIENPTQLPDDFEKKFVYVRAYDENINYLYKKVFSPNILSPENKQNFLEKYWGLGIIVLIALGIFVFFRRLFRSNEVI